MRDVEKGAKSQNPFRMWSLKFRAKIFFMFWNFSLVLEVIRSDKTGFVHKLKFIIVLKEEEIFSIHFLLYAVCNVHGIVICF